MKKIFLIITLACLMLPAMAQNKSPKWMDKERKAVVLVTTYGQNGSKISTGTGFFISETGEALAGYTLFKGAVRATVTDVDGRDLPVTTIIGANDLYDVIKFQVEVPKKVVYLPLAQEPLTNGAEVYLMPYTPGKAVPFKEGQITEVSKVGDSFGYYKLNFPLEPTQLNAPVLTADGEVFGLAQEDATGKKDISYAMSAGYVNNLRISSADAFNSVYKNVNIKKAWPQDVDQALVMLFLLANTHDSKAHLETLNDFIATFPESSEGYLNRANHYAYNRKELASTLTEQVKYLDLALQDIHTAGKYGKEKGEEKYNLAKLIYGVAVSDTTLNNPTWSVETALKNVGEAISENDLPVYHQLEGDIYFYLKQYDQAFNAYAKVNSSDMASSLSYYWAAKAKANIPGTQITEIIALLDSAVVKCGPSPTPEAASYVLERVDYRMQLGQYPQAVADYNLYYDMVGGKVNDIFYFYREQANFRLGDLEAALKDIQEAIKLSPKDATYYAEEASIYVRMEKYAEALSSVAKALELAPDFAACYRLKGVCFVRQEKKAEACEAFQKAKELGDPVADKLIKEHCK